MAAYFRMDVFDDLLEAARRRRSDAVEAAERRRQDAELASAVELDNELRDLKASYASVCSEIESDPEVCGWDDRRDLSGIMDDIHALAHRFGIEVVL